ncbi:hypothetical protein V6N12_069465 [Hibiscus sabdariffa]|uniref:Uncharacterized protein n=1 Tax=Hibiscus sabdariffa TaxID=183260 RepID=A0ABR2FE35_9ROSI
MASRVIEGVTVPFPTTSVADMVDELGQWKWYVLEHCLPVDMLLRIAFVKAPYGLNLHDAPCWRPTTNGNFQVQSIYWYWLGVQNGPLDPIWKKDS